MIEIYTTERCPYCTRAKALLAEKGLSYTEYRVDTDEAKRDEMVARAHRRTVPQIFIHGRSVGGCDDLFELVKHNRLEALLNQEQGHD